MNEENQSQLKRLRHCASQLNRLWSDMYTFCEEAQRIQASRTVLDITTVLDIDLLGLSTELRNQIKRLESDFGEVIQEVAFSDDNFTMNSLRTDSNQVETVRDDLAQKNDSLTKCRYALSALVLKEKALIQTLTPDPKLATSSVSVQTKLTYVLDPSDPEYCEDEDNVLATRQGPSAYHCKMKGWRQFDKISKRNRDDSWLDRPSDWMSEQTWLAHDLIDHSYHSDQPAVGISGLLRVSTLWVEMTTTREFCFDLKTGEFIDRSSESD